MQAVLAETQQGGLVYAETHLTANPPANTPEARVAAARGGRAHRRTDPPPAREGLRASTHGAGVSTDAAPMLVSPSREGLSQPRTRATPPPAGWHRPPPGGRGAWCTEQCGGDVSPATVGREKDSCSSARWGSEMAQ